VKPIVGPSDVSEFSGLNIILIGLPALVPLLGGDATRSDVGTSVGGEDPRLVAARYVIDREERSQRES
jgi:hypothetical protein